MTDGLKDTKTSIYDNPYPVIILNPTLLITSYIGYYFYLINILMIPINMTQIIIGKIILFGLQTSFLTEIFVFIPTFIIQLFFIWISFLYQIKIITFLYYNSFNYIKKYITKKNIAKKRDVLIIENIKIYLKKIYNLNEKIKNIVFFTKKIKCNNFYAFIGFLILAIFITIPNYYILPEKIIEKLNYISLSASLQNIEQGGANVIPFLPTYIIFNPSLAITITISDYYYIFEILIFPIYGIETIMLMGFDLDAGIIISMIISLLVLIPLTLITIYYQLSIIIFLYYNTFNYIIMYIKEKISIIFYKIKKLEK